MEIKISEKTRRFVLQMIPKEELLAELSPKERLAGLTIGGRRQLLRLLQEEMGNASGDASNNDKEAAKPTD
ncbi:MAG: hypothetical protein F4X14_08070 [Caldilineaceae bacterium SB0661_bin_32]|uniref:Uncharacterized protein n=1 Tax=Caldilineaceae bacterium SB0661_bin_32 TaxID=2605255 RepID=A0A6B1D620_9CHLR|nr:hypothetical protein [Caldilineaceae bacterium SB0661_bin_32]